MSGTAGEGKLMRLGAQDLNDDGQIINLVIAGSSRFYDYSVVEEILDQWIEIEGYPDLVIVGGASGVDYLAERWQPTITSSSLCSVNSGTIPGQDLRIRGEMRPHWS